ncbi:MAG: DUF4339 domain-containing protein [Chitinophagaceae bacterium]|nr:DUF4339 domain-containing protein [Chitinophagaceae bacterium]
MEQRYYLHDGTGRQGPFSLEELKTKRIARETPVWHDGLGSWTHAGRLEELSEYFTSGTASFGTAGPTPDMAQKQELQRAEEQSERKRGGQVLLVVLLVGLLVAAGVYYANRLAGPVQQQSNTVGVMTVAETERSHPADFLSAATEYSENFGADQLNIRGIITNKATLATYKDAVIRVTCYSKDKAELSTQDHTLRERFAPNSRSGFAFQAARHPDAYSIAVALVGAVGE